MARYVEGPWFRSSKNTWYATVGGKSISLKVKGANNRAEAQVAWHRVMATGDDPTPTTAPIPAPPRPTTTTPTVRSVTDFFLETKRGVVKNETLTVYGCLLKRINETWGDRIATDLKSWELTKWLNGLPVGANTKCDLGGLLSSLFRWAEGEGMLPSNPLKKLKRPARQSRGARGVMGPNDHAKLLAVAHPALRTLLTLLHETGARPSELSRLEARHVDFTTATAILDEHKTAEATGKSRLIILSPVAVEILKPLAEQRPTGPILRNGKSKP